MNNTSDQKMPQELVEWTDAAEEADQALEKRDYESFREAMRSAKNAFEQMRESIRQEKFIFAELDAETKQHLKRTSDKYQRLCSEITKWQQEIEKQVIARKRAGKISSSYTGKKKTVTAQRVRITTGKKRP